MLVKVLAACPGITAADGTLLRELLHPDRDAAKIRYSLAHAKLPPRRWSLLHRLKSSEVYYILAGRGTVEINGESREVKPGDAICIPLGGCQRIFSHGPQGLEFLCIVDPAWKAEDEERLETRNEK
jgi:mannose-6-phosphate isomerase-like protein (cupin superfamily)